MVKLFNILIFFITVIMSYSQVINISKNRVAKVVDRVILKSEVEKYAKMYNKTFEEALNEIIDDEIIYNIAKITLPPLDNKAIDAIINNDKAMYAYQFYKTPDSVSMAEFLNAVKIGRGTLEDYKAYVIKRDYKSRYMEYLFKEINRKELYNVSKNEIADFIKNNKEKFIIKNKIGLSTIFFSYYDNNGNLLDDQKIKAKLELANQCLSELKKNKDFINCVKQYSEDKFSLRNEPIGYLGEFSKDDYFIKSRINETIFDALFDFDKGIVDKLFFGNDGIYIFNIVSKTNQREMTDKEKEEYALDFIRNKKLEENKNNILKAKIEEYKKIFGVEYYKN